MSRFWTVLCGILIVIVGIGSVVWYRLSHSSALPWLPWLDVADSIIGLFVIGMGLSMRRHGD